MIQNENGRGVCLVLATNQEFLPGAMVAAHSFLSHHPGFARRAKRIQPISTVGEEALGLLQVAQPRHGRAPSVRHPARLAPCPQGAHPSVAGLAAGGQPDQGHRRQVRKRMQTASRMSYDGRLRAKPGSFSHVKINHPPPPPPPPQNSGNSADNRSGEPRKRSWRPPTVKTIELTETRSAPRSTAVQEESSSYGFFLEEEQS